MDSIAKQKTKKRARTKTVVLIAIARLSEGFSVVLGSQFADVWIAAGSAAAMVGTAVGAALEAAVGAVAAVVGTAVDAAVGAVAAD